MGNMLNFHVIFVLVANHLIYNFTWKLKNYLTKKIKYNQNENGVIVLVRKFNYNYKNLIIIEYLTIIEYLNILTIKMKLIFIIILLVNCFYSYGGIFDDYHIIPIPSLRGFYLGSICDRWIIQYYNKILIVAKSGEKEFYFTIQCVDLISTRPNDYNCSVMDGYQAFRESYTTIPKIPLNEATKYVINRLTDLFPDSNITKNIKYKNCCNYHKVEW